MDVGIGDAEGDDPSLRFVQLPEDGGSVWHGTLSSSNVRST